jgi:arylsulfatase A-like enzyme
MPQVTTTRRPWETIALSLVALLRPLPRTRGKPAPETTAGAEAAAVRRGEAELLSLALAVCAALFVIKGFIAYRDLDNPAVPPLVYDGALLTSLARVGACCAEDFAAGAACLLAATIALRRARSPGGRAAVRILAHLVAALAVAYVVVNAQIFHAVRHFLTLTLVRHAGGLHPDRSVYAYATTPFRLTLALAPILTLAYHLWSVRAFPRFWQRLAGLVCRPVPLVVAVLVLAAVGQAAQREVVTDSSRDYARNPHLHFLASLFGTASPWEGVVEASQSADDQVEYLLGKPGHHPGLLPRPPKNIILITAESVNSRFLETYGCRMGTTPFLRSLDEEGGSLTFENFYATSNKTIASALPIFGATYNDPTTLATVMDYGDYPTPSAANWLRAQGYTTYFFGAGGHTTWEGYCNVKPTFVDNGFDVGLDTSHPFWQAAPKPNALQEDDYLDAAMFADIHRALRGLRGRKFALWAWTYDAHAPYFDGPGPRSFPKEHFPPAIVGRAEKEAEFERHLRAIWRLDGLIGELCRELRELGLADDTLVVLTGDHGEAFGEHGWVGHGSFVYEEEVRVPCVFINPQLAPLGRRSPVLGNHVDLWATITDVCGLPANPLWQGRSLVGGDGGERRVYFHSHESALGVREEKYKYIWDCRESRHLLFDMGSDPLEKHNLAGEQPELCAAQQRRVRAWATFQTQLTKERLAGAAGR